jgi:CheY-like chemotaxis protein
MIRTTPLVLFIDDEEYYREAVGPILKRMGCEVKFAGNGSEALAHLQELGALDLLIADLQFPVGPGGEISRAESDGERLTGLVVAREVRKKFPSAPILIWTHSRDHAVYREVRALRNAFLVAKGREIGPLTSLAHEFLRGMKDGDRPVSFLVHGHDEQTMRSTEDYLHKKLGFPAPIILRQQANGGHTLIEKLETHAINVDLVFVLLTPDDRVVSPGVDQVDRMRSRQNVIFELGFFLGLLGRSSGRVILLYKHPVELPSDIHGVVSIDISDGIEAADAQIRREVCQWIEEDGA